MKRFKRWHIGLLGVCVGGAVVYLALSGASAAEQESDTLWPPQLPRERATKLFENEHVIVWEQVGFPEEPFVHKHVRDVLGFIVEPGAMEVLGPDLERTTAGVEFTDVVYSKGSSTVVYTRAGLGPHAEMSPDPSALPTMIVVELKGTEPEDCAEWSTACQ